LIAAESLSVTFGNTVALDDLDLRIGPGITGLFGPNGSGKTTLLRVIAGLLRPSSGRLTIDGVDSWAGRHMVGYAGHDSGLYRNLTIGENLRLFARLYGAADRRVDDVLGSLGLEMRAGMVVGELSAGMVRRTAVARALLHDPAVLLLDEPYANLDDEAAELLSEAVKSWRRNGRIAVIATHGAKRVKAFADAGIILKDGRVAVSGRYRASQAAAGEAGAM
jgi:heme ABC exporter ATP-binding subunit CcmA